MIKRSRPTGFVAVCRCGQTVGALDANRTERKEMGQILGRWLFEGCTVSPRFDGTWSAAIESCLCGMEDGL